MKRLGHEARTNGNIIISASRTARPIESFEPEARLEMERKYKQDPSEYRSRLIYQGFWYVAAQLKTDFEAGRL
jgi:hypothetical protein